MYGSGSSFTQRHINRGGGVIGSRNPKIVVPHDSPQTLDDPIP
jgi:hypothetical protein